MAYQTFLSGTIEVSGHLSLALLATVPTYANDSALQVQCKSFDNGGAISVDAAHTGQVVDSLIGFLTRLADIAKRLDVELSGSISWDGDERADIGEVTVRSDSDDPVMVTHYPPTESTPADYYARNF